MIVPGSANPLLLGDAGYNIQRSLRFRSSASAYLSRTTGTPTNQGIYTLSIWFKRGSIGSDQLIMMVNQGGQYTGIQITAANELNFFFSTGSGNHTDRKTTAVFRDPSSWYHIMVVADYTQAAGSQIKYYVNGVTMAYTATGSGTNLTQTNTVVNAASKTINFGRDPGYASGYIDGYVAEAFFIDGQALTPSSFGQTDPVTGVWTPKKYTGTYGTNGFYLDFKDNTSATTLAYDKSGNGNNWTANNISTTAGSTYDSMLDVPTLTSATAANYCVLNPLKNYGMGPTDGNLSVSSSASTGGIILGTIGMTSGKWYWEFTQTSFATTNAPMIGIATDAVGMTNYVGTDAYGWGYFGNNGQKQNAGTATSYGASYTNNDVIGVAFDADAGTLVFYKNNVSQGTAFTGLTSGPYFPAFSDAGTAATTVANVNFGQRPFSYTPPTGFKALNTFNLPDPTIKKPNQYMDATTYTGTGSALSVTNAAGFQPDFVWVKGRSGATDHALYDAVRGVQKQLESNTTTAETTETTGLTAFNSNGFSVGALAQMNTNAATYVGWQWQAGKGTTSSNTSGSRTSTVSVNATAGFSIVSYPGQTNTPATIGHGLGVAPKFIITKNRTTGTYDGDVWHTALAGTQYLVLNSTAAAATNANAWNSTTPTSTVFSVGQFGGTCGLTGDNMIAYLFAEIPGFSKFGSYTGNGSADGPFVYCGFRPKFVLWKRTDTGGYNWNLYDTSRSPYNLMDLPLAPNISDAESVSTSNVLDGLSNGFKVRGTSVASNANGGTYIYACFAESPFKTSLAR